MPTETGSTPPSPRGTKMMHRYPHLPVVAAVVAVTTLFAPGARAAGFDGNWTVLVITESGSCDAAYRYGVNVENGAVRYRGESGIDVRGSVDPGGHVRVAIGRGEQRAEGAGRLTGESGSGTWTGSSAASRCTGRWEAERRQ
jgi:hypothetical protein